MKKKFEKILALVLSVLMIASQIGVIAFAEESAAPTIEDYQAISDPVKVTADAYTNDSPMRTFNNDTTIHDSCGVVYKVEFPDMEGKEFKNFIFRFGSWFYGGDSMRVMGLPADTDVANLSESDEPFASMWANEAAYKCNVGSVLGDNFYATLYHNYADITAYANECLKAGDDYMYIVVDSASTGKAFSSNLTDSSYIGWDMYPYYYYDTNDIPVYDPENPTIEGIQAISEPVQVTGPTYSDGEPMKPYINENANICSAFGVVYKVDLPDMAGKEFEHFIFRFSTSFYGGSSLRVMGVPADTDIDNLGRSDEPFASMWANQEANKCNVGPVLGDNFAYNYYKNYADITEYANKCLDAGDEYMYIAVGSASTAKAFSSELTDSTYIGYDMYPYYYHSTKEKDITLSLTQTNPENGAKDIKADTAVEFTFSNAIEFASATVNGKDAEANWDKNKVTVTAEFKQYTDYTVEVEITDIYGQELKSQVAFTTGGAFVSPKQTDGESWYITSSGSRALTDRQSIDLRQNNFVLHKIPVPQVNDGEILNSYKLSYILYPAGYATYVLKFEGEDWDPDSMTSADEEVANILANYKNYNVTESQTNELIETNHYCHTDDITAYVNECILLGQEYMYVGVITPASTMQTFGYNVSDSGWKRFATYGTYSTVYPEFSAINAQYEVNGASLDKMSFSVLTDAENFANSVVLRDKATKTAVNATFAFNEYSRALSLASSVALSENTEYEVVIKAGTEDYYGNKASEDIVCLSFETGKNYEIAELKLTNAEASAYDSAEAVATPDKTSSYKAATKVTNNTNSDVDVIIFVAKYDESGNKLLGVNTVKKTVEAGAENVDVLSDALAQAGEAGIIKVSLWNSNLKPLAETLLFEVK